MRSTREAIVNLPWPVAAHPEAWSILSSIRHALEMRRIEEDYDQAYRDGSGTTQLDWSFDPMVPGRLYLPSLQVAHSHATDNYYEARQGLSDWAGNFVDQAIAHKDDTLLPALYLELMDGSDEKFSYDLRATCCNALTKVLSQNENRPEIEAAEVRDIRLAA